MICAPCRAAADAHAPADQHCGSTGGPGAHCTCQHRTDRYQPKPDDDLSALDALWEQYLGTIYRTTIEATYLPPAACRCGGQSFAGQILHRDWCPWKNDPTPLRAIAAQALGTAPLPPMIRLLADGEDPNTAPPAVPLAALQTTPHTDTTED